MFYSSNLYNTINSKIRSQTQVKGQFTAVKEIVQASYWGKRLSSSHHIQKQFIVSPHWKNVALTDPLGGNFPLFTLPVVQKLKFAVIYGRYQIF